MIVLITERSIRERIKEKMESAKAEHDEVWGELAKGTPEACEQFINKYCWTLNPDLPNPESRFILYGYQEDFIGLLFRILDGRKFAHVDKSRQMGDSWVVCAFMLYCLLFVPGFTSLTLSRKVNDIDDGGERTVDSLFGRIKFMYDRLPGWMQSRAQVSFAFVRITAKCNPGAFLVGEGATPEAARHGSYMFGFWDEMAMTPFARAIITGWRRSVRSGIYLSTPKGKSNEFARLKRVKSEKMVHESHRWMIHPVYGEGAYKDRHGRWRSPWYDRETEDMLDDAVASELDISYEGSVAGIIYREWDSGLIIEPNIPYNPGLPIYTGWDFGRGDDTAIVVSQFLGDEERIIASYSVAGGLPDQHSDAFLELLGGVGFKGNLSDITFYGDPSGAAKTYQTGTSAFYEYERLFSMKANQTVNFIPAGHYMVEDGIRACRRRLKAGKVRVSAKATEFIDGIEAYQREVNRQGEVKDNAPPKHDWSSHIMDGWRYQTTGLFGIEAERRAEEPFVVGTSRPREWVVKR